MKIIYYFFLLLTVVSCGKKRIVTCDADYSVMDTICYDYTKDNFIERDSVFGKISFLTLETRDDNLIGMVDQVLFGDSTIIVVDRMIANGVFMFDFEGKYIGKISGLGNGHNEYRRLSYVCKRPDKTIAIFDELSSAIMIYNERGQYIETISTDGIYGSAIEFITNDIIALDIYNRYPDFYEPYGNMSFLVKDIDMTNRYQFGRTDYGSNFNYTRYYNLYSYDNKVYCNVNFEDYIFELKADSVKAKYKIMYGPENVNNYPYAEKEELYALQKEYPFYEGEFVELKDHTYLMFRGENGRELIYKHSTKETYALSSFFNNPMVAFFRRPIARYGDQTLVCALTVSETLLCKGILTSSSTKNESIDKLFASINIDSNPILFFYEVVF